MAVWLGVHKVNFLESSVPVGTIDVSLNITFLVKQANKPKQQITKASKKVPHKITTNRVLLKVCYSNL